MFRRRIKIETVYQPSLARFRRTDMDHTTLQHRVLSTVVHCAVHKNIFKPILRIDEVIYNFIYCTYKFRIL